MKIIQCPNCGTWIDCDYPDCWRCQQKPKAALERSMEMMYIPIKDLPPLAREFANKLCREVGMCMETLITAYAVYAQCVEGLPCRDSLYAARNIDYEWFKNEMGKESANKAGDLSTQ